MSGHGEPVPMTARKSGALKGRAEVPGDKSISHRSLILGAMAVGETQASPGFWRVRTFWTPPPRCAPSGPKWCGTGWVTGRSGAWVWAGFREPDSGHRLREFGDRRAAHHGLHGDLAHHVRPSPAMRALRKRPMGRVTDPLSLFGARAYGRQGGRLPMTIVGAADPVPVRYTVPMPSAQVKSAVLLAGLNAPGQTVVIEKEPTRDHSERMLRGFGAELTVEDTSEGRVITLTGQPELRPQTVAVPRDPSSAAFPVCAALIVEGIGHPRPRRQPEPHPQRALHDARGDGGRHRLPEPARGGGRAGRRPARPLLLPQGDRGAGGARGLA